MGVPGLYGWLERKYKPIKQPIKLDTSATEPHICDHLYIDFNHIAHACSHPGWRHTKFPHTQAMFEAMEAYLENLMSLVRPERLLYVAVDGVAPQAKMAQQRQRRFLAAYTEVTRLEVEAEVRREMESELQGLRKVPPLVSVKDFDSNVLTPGTRFMSEMSQHLRKFFLKKAGENAPFWENVQVILSDSAEPGEGEHKIMRFIRHLRTLPDYDPNTRHVIYGQDADLILLSLLTHEAHVTILREDGKIEDIIEEKGFDPDAQDFDPTSLQPLHYLHVPTLRQFLKIEFAEILPEAPDVGQGTLDGSTSGSSLVDPPPTGDAAFERQRSEFFEHVLEDLVLLTFLAGNDFLPGIPSLEIHMGALDALVAEYKELRKGGQGFITTDGVISLDNLRALLDRLAKLEEKAFQAREKRARQIKQKEDGEAEAMEAMWAERGFTGPDGSNQWISMGELSPGDDADDLLAALAGVPSGSQLRGEELLNATDWQLQHEAAKRTMKRTHDRLMGGASRDPIRLTDPGFRSRYYVECFGAQPGENVEKVARKVSHAFLAGMSWVMAYYVRGSVPVILSRAHEHLLATAATAAGQGFPTGATWDWYYSYHYAPLISDLAKFVTGLTKVKAGKPFVEPVQAEDSDWAEPQAPVRPLVQLMAVMPPSSALRALPRKLAQLLLDTQKITGGLGIAGALADMFPKDMSALIDVAGKKFLHTAVVKVPFADVQRLAEAAVLEAPDPAQELNETEHERNKMKSGTLIMSAQHPLASRFLARARGESENEDGSLEADAGLTSTVSGLLDVVVPGTAVGEGGDVLQFSADVAGLPAIPFGAHLLEGVEEMEVDTSRWMAQQARYGGRGRGRGDDASAFGRGRGRGRDASVSARGMSYGAPGRGMNMRGRFAMQGSLGGGRGALYGDGHHYSSRGAHGLLLGAASARGTRGGRNLGDGLWGRRGRGVFGAPTRDQTPYMSHAPRPSAQAQHLARHPGTTPLQTHQAGPRDMQHMYSQVERRHTDPGWDASGRAASGAVHTTPQPTWDETSASGWDGGTQGSGQGTQLAVGLDSMHFPASAESKASVSSAANGQSAILRESRPQPSREREPSPQRYVGSSWDEPDPSSAAAVDLDAEWEEMKRQERQRRAQEDADRRLAEAMSRQFEEEEARAAAATSREDERLARDIEVVDTRQAFENRRLTPQDMARLAADERLARELEMEDRRQSALMRGLPIPLDFNQYDAQPLVTAEQFPSLAAMAATRTQPPRPGRQSRGGASNPAHPNASRTTHGWD